MSLVTILTPSYNRCDCLPVLYQSLEMQTNKDFEWLIVDDGSKDNTKNYIEGIARHASFPITYVEKKNGGKHTALNVGIREIATVLTIIVDSDDTLLPHAVELIHQYYFKYKSGNNIAAFTFLKCYKNGKPVISLDKAEFVDSYIEYRIRKNRPGDMAEVFYTTVLKEFTFPEFDGERFLSEDVVWIQIGLKYKFVFINSAIYVCEYLEGGLTDNDKPLKFSSPLGSMLRGKMLMKTECGIKANIRGAIIYNCYKQEVCQTPGIVQITGWWQKALQFCTLPFGRFFNKRWKK